MVVESPTHVRPGSVPIFTAKRPGWSGKRKVFFFSFFLFKSSCFMRLCHCLEKNAIILESEEGSGFSSNMCLWFSQSRPFTVLEHQPCLICVEAFSVPWKPLFKQKLKEKQNKEWSCSCDLGCWLCRAEENQIFLCILWGPLLYPHACTQLNCEIHVCPLLT